MIHTASSHLASADTAVKKPLQCVNPIAIGGCGSSGTTLISHLLSCHPNIYCGPEWFVLHVPAIYQQFASLSAIEKEQLVRDGLKPFSQSSGKAVATPFAITVRKALYRSIYFISPYKREEFGISDDRFVQWAQQAQSFDQFLDAMFMAIMDSHGKTRWADKTPQNCYAIGEFLDLYPEGRYIHMVRDGRDTCRSLLKRVDMSPRQVTQRWLVDTAQVLPYLNHQRVFVLKYEDLVTDPEATLAQVLAFAGEDPSLAPQMLRHATQPDTPQHAEMFHHESWANKPTEPISPKAVGSWQKLEPEPRKALEGYFNHIYLNQNTTRRFGLEKPVNANQLMVRFGYDATDGGWNVKTPMSAALWKEWLLDLRYFRHPNPYCGLKI